MFAAAFCQLLPCLAEIAAALVFKFKWLNARHLRFMTQKPIATHGNPCLNGGSVLVFSCCSAVFAGPELPTLNLKLTR